MRWVCLALGAALLWVVVRWVLRATSGVGQARDRAFESLRRIVSGATEITREPGLVVVASADDRIELDYTAVLKAALAHRAGGAALDEALIPIVESACEAQTDPGQMAEERDEAADTLGERAAKLSDGALLRALFGHADPQQRDAALLASVATPPARDPHEEGPT